MKKFSKITFSLILVTLLVCLSAFSSFAAEVLTVNGKEAPVGSNVTYTFAIGDAHQNLCGIHLVVFFEQDYLALKEVNTDNLGGGTIVNDNKGNNGRVIITNSFINGTEGLECKESTDIVSVTFEVIKEGTTDITYYMPYLYDIDSVNIYDYSFTCELTVDGEVVIENEVPALQDISKVENFGDAGDFENNEAGTGSGEKPVAPATPAADNDNNPDDEGKNSGIAIPIICASVIVVAIVVLVVVKSVTGKKSDEDDNGQNT